jgi:DNA-binding MarR family transcriptional regulator
MGPASKSESSSLERLIEELDARLPTVDLVVRTRVIASWAQTSELSLEEARLLVVLATSSDPPNANQLAALSGIDIDHVYPRLGRLSQRGYTRENQRRYSLTDQGKESVASLEAAGREGVAAYVSDLAPEDRRRLGTALGVDPARCRCSPTSCAISQRAGAGNAEGARAHRRAGAGCAAG